MVVPPPEEISTASLPPTAENKSAVTVAAGVPLHVRVTRTTPLHMGEAVDAIVEQPVYVRDRVAISNGTVLHGVVSGTEPASRMDRTKAWLNADLTPQRTPVILFRSMDGEGGPMPLDAEARIRPTQWVHFVPAQKRGNLWTMGKAMVCDRVESTRASLFEAGKMDRGLRLFYSQLPYHPQRIWAGTQMIADLRTTSAVPLPEAAPVPLAAAGSTDLSGLRVVARLTEDVNSDRAKKNDAVMAVVTEPVFDAKGALVLPEGSSMQGRVLASKPSRSFGRNGSLRFVFAGVQREGEEAQRAHGVLTGASGASAENLSVDQEGGIKAQPDRNRFLAPVLLGALALAGHDEDRDGGGGGGNVGGQVVAANGLGLIGRVLALTVRSPNMATGFGAFAFAKSVTFRFLTPGHPVDFARDTMVEVELQSR